MPSRVRSISRSASAVLSAAALHLLFIFIPPATAQHARAWTTELSFENFEQFGSVMFAEPKLELSTDEGGDYALTVTLPAAAGPGVEPTSGLGASTTGNFGVGQFTITLPLRLVGANASDPDSVEVFQRFGEFEISLSGNVEGEVGFRSIQGTAKLSTPDLTCSLQTIALDQCSGRMEFSGRWTAYETTPELGPEAERLRELQEQNAAREAAIPPDCRIEILRVVGTVEIIQELPVGPQASADIEIGGVNISGGSTRSGAIPLNEGSRAICATDTIYTGMESSVTYRTSDGKIVTVGELADVVPSRRVTNSDPVKTRLWLKAGEISAEIENQQPIEVNFSVETGEAGASPRATMFTVRRIDGATPRTIVRVTRGTVEVTPVNPDLPIVLVHVGGEVQVTAHEVTPRGDTTLKPRSGGAAEVESESGPAMDFAASEPAPADGTAASCDISGDWRMSTENVGQSTWTFLAGKEGHYSVEENGIGNATGTAVLQGSTLHIDWQTGGGAFGTVDIDLNADCTVAEGTQVIAVGHPVGTHSTRFERITPPTPAASSGTSAGSMAAACDIGGDWRMSTENVGESTWTFVAVGENRYTAQENGLGSATGTAALQGSTLHIDWQTGGGASGTVDIDLNADCTVAEGTQVIAVGHPVGTHHTGFERVTAPGTETAAETAGDATTFSRPRHNNAALDWCLNWATDCGQVAAHQFCVRLGFASASRFETYAAGRTYVIGSSQYCEGEHCLGFDEISCVGLAPRADAPADTVVATASDPLIGSWQGCDGRVIEFQLEAGLLIGRYTALGGLGAAGFGISDAGYFARPLPSGGYTVDVRHRSSDGSSAWVSGTISLDGDTYTDNASDSCSQRLTRVGGGASVSSATQSPADQPGPPQGNAAAAPCDFTGTWTDSFGVSITLTQVGNTVSGSYIFQGVASTINGTVTNGLLTGIYQQPTYPDPQWRSGAIIASLTDCNAWSGNGSNSTGTATRTWSATRVVPQQPATVGQNFAAIRGMWVGWHECSGVQVGTAAVIEVDAGGSITGIRQFYPSSSDLGRAVGSFMISGRFEPSTGQISLIAGTWIHEPPGYGKCDFFGSLDPTATRIAGTSPGCGCGEFSLARQQ